MLPGEIPRELINMLDTAAGKQHSMVGPVIRSLAAILTRYDEMRERWKTT